MQKTNTTRYKTKTNTTNIEGPNLIRLSRYCYLKLIMGHIPFGETPPGQASSCCDLVGEIA
jgi:hypothetical protein